MDRISEDRSGSTPWVRCCSAVNSGNFDHGAAQNAPISIPDACDAGPVYPLAMIGTPDGSGAYEARPCRGNDHVASEGRALCAPGLAGTAIIPR